MVKRAACEFWNLSMDQTCLIDANKEEPKKDMVLEYSETLKSFKFTILDRSDMKFFFAKIDQESKNLLPED